MKDNLRLYELLVKQHYEELTPDEEEELKAFEALNPRFYEYKAQVQEVPKADAMAFSGSVDTDAALEDVFRGAARIKRTRKIRRIATGAAAAAAVVMLVIFLRPQQEV